MFLNNQTEYPSLANLKQRRARTMNISAGKYVYGLIKYPFCFKVIREKRIHILFLRRKQAPVRFERNHKVRLVSFLKIYRCLT